MKAVLGYSLPGPTFWVFASLTEIKFESFPLSQKWRHGRSQSVIFNSGQKMALRSPYVAICQQALRTFMKGKRSQRQLFKTTDWDLGASIELELKIRR